jgi:hypothetical protein
VVGEVLRSLPEPAGEGKNGKAGAQEDGGMGVGLEVVEPTGKGDKYKKPV